MAALTSTWPTLVDVAKRLDPDGKIPPIAEIMTQANPILEDMPMLEGNLPTGHRGVIRTGLPTVAWRVLNYGTLPSKSTTKQIDDACGMLEAYSEIDKELFNLNGAGEAFRLSEDTAHIEAMAQELASTLFYGNTSTNPEEFLGLSPRFSEISTLTTHTGSNIVNCGGSGSDNTSMWLIAWGERTVHGIFPKGQKAGLEYQNLGENIKRDSSDSGRLMQVLTSHFIQKIGLHVKDWGGIVRLANIDVSELSDAGEQDFDGADLVLRMFDAMGKIPSRLENYGRWTWYCNRTVHTALTKMAIFSKTANMLSIETLTGGPFGPKRMTTFCGIPIRKCDALVSTETAVS